MFTIVLIDFKKKLFVFKDKLGLKPLFYYFNDEKLFISSESKSIVNCNNDTKINYQNSLASIFLCGRPPYSNSHFDNIYDLEQSTYLCFDYFNHTINIKKYFSLDQWINEEEYNKNKKLKKKIIFRYSKKLLIIQHKDICLVIVKKEIYLARV